MKARYLISIILIILLFGCSRTGNEPISTNTASTNMIVVGFSQLGAESDWRSANTQSMTETFTQANGYTMLFDDGQQKQTNQIMAIRRFIQQDVDYIVLAPVTETGWDTVLAEAKDAGIPVVIVDRMVDVEDESLFSCWVGSDFELEGKKAAEWLHQYAIAQNIAAEDLNIVNIQGTIGATAQIGRTRGLENAAATYGWDLLEEASGDFTQAKGREVMEYFLQTYDNINVVYCENDNEALGAIEAIEAAGKHVGSDIQAGDIMVISFDGVNEQALSYVAEGKITCIIECNPLHGPRVETIIENLEAGVEMAKHQYVDEGIYSANTTVQQITVDGVTYNVNHK